MTTKYEYYNTGDSGAEGAYGATWQAQVFLVGATGHTVTSVKLKLARYGSPNTVTVSIRATTDGKPSGSDLTVGTTNGNTLPTGSPYEWREITLTEYTLSANTKYAIVVRALTGNIDNYVAWRDDGGYADGDYCYSVDSGSSWTSNAYHDFMFEVWGNPAGVAYTKTVSEILGLVDAKSSKTAFHKTTSEVLGLVDDYDKNRCKKCKPSVTLTF